MNLSTFLFLDRWEKKLMGLAFVLLGATLFLGSCLVCPSGEKRVGDVCIPEFREFVRDGGYIE